MGSRAVRWRVFVVAVMLVAVGVAPARTAAQSGWNKLKQQVKQAQQQQQQPGQQTQQEAQRRNSSQQQQAQASNGANPGSGTFTPPAGTADPLAGQVIFLMKNSFDNVMKSVGAPLPPGTSAGEAWLAFTQACRPPADCKALLSAMSPFFAGKTTMPGNGRGAFAPSVPAGTYYVLTSARVNNRPAFWDVKVDLKPRANSVVLDQSNTEPVN